MLVKLFVLGRPGSGKSKTVHHIEEFAKLHGWVPHSFKDFGILEKMAQEDDLHQQFHPFEYEVSDVLGNHFTYKGFDVTDYVVFDEALKVLENDINRHTLTIEGNALIITEFARDDYDRAFRQFSKDFLQDAYFILIDTDLETCKRRIHERVTHYTTPDDHFVSNFALDTHYFKQQLPKNSSIRKRFKIVRNQQSWQPFTRKIHRILKEILNVH